MGAVYEYEVTADLPEIGARVWDVVVVRGEEVYLCRKRREEVRARRLEAGEVVLLTEPATQCGTSRTPSA